MDFIPRTPNPRPIRGPVRDRWGQRLVVRGSFLALLALLATLRLVPLPHVPVLILAAGGLALYVLTARRVFDPRIALTFLAPALDLGLLYVLVAYTPEPQSWGSLAYVWLAGMIIVTRDDGSPGPMLLYAAGAYATLAVAATRSSAPLAYMAGHTVSMALFALVGATYLRDRRVGRHDALTGALDRRAGIVEFERWTRRRRPFTVAFVDLRDFKRINDTLGHAAGDDALRIIGRRLRHTLRSHDLVVRYGGDEFLVASHLTDLGARIAGALHDPVLTASGTVEVQADIGIMAWRAGMPLRDIVAEADRRMYAAKRAAEADSGGGDRGSGTDHLAG